MFFDRALFVATAASITLFQATDSEPPNVGQITVGVLLAIYVVKEVVVLLAPLFKGGDKKADESDSSKISRIEGWVRDLWYHKQMTERMCTILEEMRDFLRDSRHTHEHDQTSRSSPTRPRTP